MTDSTTAPLPPSATPTTVPSEPPVGEPTLSTAADGAPTKGQSPLDVLDQILNDAQSKSKEAEAAKAEEEQRKIQEDLQRQRERDAAELASKLQELQSVKQSPQYQALVEQQQEEVHQKEEHTKQMDGLEIIQLGHTKI